MRKDTGGPAFPTQEIPGILEHWDGMTLRDWFAGQALSGILAHDSAVNPILLKMIGSPGLDRADVAAMAAGRIADAMIAERNKP